MLVVGTYRETELGEPLASVLADLRRERALERLRLGSLHRGEVATMISVWLGRAPPTHFAHALHRETEGNPFFIEEVLRHLIEVGAVDDDRVGAPGLVHGARHTGRRAGGDRAAPGHACRRRRAAS